MGHHKRRRTRSHGLLYLFLAMTTLCAAHALRAEVRQGMHRDEILAAWGKPSASIKQANREIISYGDGREAQLVDDVAWSVLNPNAITATNELQPTPTPTPSPLLSPSLRQRAQQFKPELRKQLVAHLSAIPLPEISPARLLCGCPRSAPIFLGLFLVLLHVVATWKVYAAAGEHGWAAGVPIYTTIVLLRIAGKPIWWLLLLCIPIVNILPLLLVSIGLARNFGRGVGFGLGLLLLPVIFYPILAFGHSKHSPTG